MSHHDDPGPRLFSFAVIADSHVEPPRADEPRSNRRLRLTVAAVRALRPAFAVHLGDIVHPLPELASAAAAWDEALALLDGLGCPLHVTPGNHDIGDKPNPMMPAAAVRLAWLKRYTRIAGPARKVVDHAGCRLVLLDSPSMNADPAADAELLAWLEASLAGAGGRRLLVATHYPLFLNAPDEPGHYDNVDQPVRGRLLGLLKRFAVEAVLTGHVHNLFLNRIGRTAFYGVPSHAFVRRDFAELFRVAPLAEHGREDPEKLGFLLVDVHAKRHVARFVRLPDYAEQPGRVVVPGHLAAGATAPFGVDLRHPWAESVAFPFNPPTDAFARKRVRDDYPVQALLDLGLRHVRVPLEDLEDSATRARMADLGRLGMRFTAFAASVPDARLEAALRAAPEALDTLELIGLRGDLLDRAAAVADRAASARIAVVLNELRPAGATSDAAWRGKNRIDVGQSVDDPDAAAALAGAIPGGVSRPGLVFRARAEAVSAALIAGLERFAAAHGVGVVLHIVWAAEDMSADAAHADGPVALVERLLAMPPTGPGLRLFLDTFMDIDRGYHVRRGLIDRRGNLTRAGLVLRAALADRERARR